jgi:hypothetical protein
VPFTILLGPAYILIEEDMQKEMARIDRFEGLVVTTDNGDTVLESKEPKSLLPTETYVVKRIDCKWYLVLVE